MTQTGRPGVYEFFAGGGMVRAGLGSGWDCLFANDVDARKGLSYQANWGLGGELTIGDVAQVSATDLPGRADLAWASFPCQDLSLAGVGAGLGGARSGTFHAFWRVMTDLSRQGRAPALVTVENVCGTLTSHGGRDFQAICRTFSDAGYRFGALVINADLFVPQSRPRLFVIGVHDSVDVDPSLLCPGPITPFHTRPLVRATDGFDDDLRARLLWWSLPMPTRRMTTFADMIEDHPDSVSWQTPEETTRLLAMMSPLNLAKVDQARRAGGRRVGGVYRRTRRTEDGGRIQRAEVRFDDVAGCLRTPAGGSSRQVILVVDGDSIRSRLISTRETARLMGLDDSYRLPRTYGEAYHLTGDGVVVPVVRHLAHHLFEPVVSAAAIREAA